MITADTLKAVNEKIKTITVKGGKQYAMVKDRVLAFREACPGGSIVSTLLDSREGVYLFEATISDDEGRILAVAHASEKEGTSQVNSTSALENAETSAIGRALGLAGFGIDASMASADEVANALIQQNDKRPASDVERKTFTDLCALNGIEPTDVLTKCGWKGGRMTYEQYGRALAVLKEVSDGR